MSNIFNSLIGKNYASLEEWFQDVHHRVTFRLWPKPAPDGTLCRDVKLVQLINDPVNPMVATIDATDITEYSPIEYFYLSEITLNVLAVDQEDYTDTKQTIE